MILTLCLSSCTTVCVDFDSPIRHYEDHPSLDEGPRNKIIVLCMESASDSVLPFRLIVHENGLLM